MDNLIEEINEEIKRDKVIQFIKAYGKSILLAITAIIIGSGAFLLWQQHVYKNKVIFTQHYYEIIENINRNYIPQAEQALQELNLQSKAHGELSVWLDLVATHVEARNDSEAYQRFYNQHKTKKTDRNLLDLSLIMSVLHQWAKVDFAEKISPEEEADKIVYLVDNNAMAPVVKEKHQNAEHQNISANYVAKMQELRAQIVPLTGPSTPYRFTANELCALLSYAEGEKDVAHGIFSQIVQNSMAPSSLRQRARMMGSSLSSGPTHTS